MKTILIVIAFLMTISIYSSAHAGCTTTIFPGGTITCCCTGSFCNCF